MISSQPSFTSPRCLVETCYSSVFLGTSSHASVFPGLVPANRICSLLHLSTPLCLSVILLSTCLSIWMAPVHVFLLLTCRPDALSSYPSSSTRLACAAACLTHSRAVIHWQERGSGQADAAATRTTFPRSHLVEYSTGEQWLNLLPSAWPLVFCLCARTWACNGNCSLFIKQRLKSLLTFTNWQHPAQLNGLGEALFKAFTHQTFYK